VDCFLKVLDESLLDGEHHFDIDNSRAKKMNSTSLTEVSINSWVIGFTTIIHVVIVLLSTVSNTLGVILVKKRKDSMRLFRGLSVLQFLVAHFVNLNQVKMWSILGLSFFNTQPTPF